MEASLCWARLDQLVVYGLAAVFPVFTPSVIRLQWSARCGVLLRSGFRGAVARSRRRRWLKGLIVEACPRPRTASPNPQIAGHPETCLPAPDGSPLTTNLNLLWEVPLIACGSSPERSVHPGQRVLSRPHRPTDDEQTHSRVFSELGPCYEQGERHCRAGGECSGHWALTTATVSSNWDGPARVLSPCHDAGCRRRRASWGASNGQGATA